MVNALHAQHVQRAPDVIRRAFLARMGDLPETLGFGLGKDALELLRGMPNLRGVQPHRHNPLPKRLRGL